MYTLVIQRWQSLRLLVAAVMMGCFTFCSLGQIQTTDFTYNFTSLGFFQEGIPTDGEVATETHTWYFFVLSLTTTVILLIDIFLFKNLPLQKKVCLISVLFIIASAATAGALSPVIALFAAIIAYSCMRRDHNRLKAVDRIR